MAASIPLGIKLLPSINVNRSTSYRIFVLIFTFFCYASYHLSRKPISVVKNVLHQNCSEVTPHGKIPVGENDTWCDWAPFDDNSANSLLGYLDVSFLFAYAVGMFISGHVAERIPLRYFLSSGMIMSGLLCALFGMGYFWNIHALAFYICVQIASGFFQSTGWPAVVACVGNWYGKGRRGLIMGIWNSHTSVGNILGAVIPAIFVKTAWGWSFIVPGMIIGGLGILVFLFLVPHPSDVNCDDPNQDAKPLLSKVSDNNEESLLTSGEKHQAISLIRALKIPGVIEFSLCLFFAKLVSYTFLFWLPKYIENTTPYGATKSADLSTLFDVGGIIGGILAGVISDHSGARASTCFIMLAAAAPMLYIYNVFGDVSYGASVVQLLCCGLLVNGPYALITTAVSADLGTHKSLMGNARALATVTAIIDGTGSIGAALGPLATGWISASSSDGWQDVFYMLIGANVCAMILLSRLVYKEIRSFRCFGGQRIHSS
ncbi:hypothetical protein LOTGIDRAFT_213082 [Lottia gigantea]|uniref:Sugar phosphate exchanger 3 n=1 Tax=Lottia gigantea TaxID=225164 RepID=V4A7K4_LOTGI|nr:hypothetical protein LOTGIDRAFT_213082 [Lottia gigantea]ESO99923.1 hypothetical protein LOTGIDRAFT_213082 [Lottia gigantea]